VRVRARKCLNCGFKFRQFSILHGWGKCPKCGSDLIVTIEIDTETGSEEVVDSGGATS